jgi:hypothetical protein
MITAYSEAGALFITRRKSVEHILPWSIPYSNDLVKGTSVALENRRKPYRC